MTKTLTQFNFLQIFIFGDVPIRFWFRPFIYLQARRTIGPAVNKESPTTSVMGLPLRFRHRPTLPHVTAVPSALAGLTSLFGMGRGGHRRYRHLNILNVVRKACA